jgi:formate dehydrogenase iron-sulfur subunit
MKQANLEIRRSSASLIGESTSQRRKPVVAKFIDTTTCIGCKACEVACQEWNDLPTLETKRFGSYQTLPTLQAEYWNLIKFAEVEDASSLTWLMRKDNCMHCDEPGCLEACPAPGAIVQYENGIVDVNPEACIGCGYCETGCPFDVPRFSERTSKMSKCTLCVDRVTVGVEPACVKSCPTGCLHFGTKEDMLALGERRITQLHENGHTQAAMYDPPGVGGTSVVTVLMHGDHPEWYGLPRDPHVPHAVIAWKKVLRPLGAVAIFAAIAGAFAHYLRFGRKQPPEESDQVESSAAEARMHGAVEQRRNPS